MKRILMTLILLGEGVQAAPVPSPQPLPPKECWPAKVHILKPSVMVGAGGGVRMTKPSGTEVNAVLSNDLQTLGISLKDPDLSGTVPLNDTDFVQLAKEKENQLADEKAAEQKRLTEAFDATMRQVAEDREAYGNEPVWGNTGLFGPVIPSIVERNLKRRLKDPDSMKIRSVSAPTHSEFNGVKCWKLNCVISSRNSFGGMGSAIVTAWIHNGDLLDLSIVSQ
jgi:hypothetical protein